MKTAEEQNFLMHTEQNFLIHTEQSDRIINFHSNRDAKTSRNKIPKSQQTPKISIINSNPKLGEDEK